MPMIDLAEHLAEADGQVNKFTVKADGKTEDAFIYDVDVVFVIDTVDDAKVAEHVIPGCVEVFHRSQREDDNWKFNTTVNPDMGAIKAIISHAERGKVAMDGGAEVKSVRLRSSKKATACTIKLAFGGQTALGAANLAGMLRATCCLSLERQQQVIPFPAGGAAPPPAKGDLLVAWDAEVGETYVGRLAESEGEQITLEDFDNEYVVKSSDITSVLKLDGDVSALRRSYTTRCGRREMTPSWTAILMAFAEGESLGATGAVTLTAEVIERAVARLESGDDEMVPPVSAEA